MRIIFSALFFVAAMLLFDGCSIEHNGKSADQFLEKAMFNSEWLKQGVGPDEWYYRSTVIEAPANTEALSIADGHWLHPELIRFEITKDKLIGRRSHAAAINADLELSSRRNYKGAPVVAYAIVEHFDVSNDCKQKSVDACEKIKTNPWFQRKYFTIDFSRNLVSRQMRSDSDDGALVNIQSETTDVVDNSWLGNPKRSRINHNTIDFVTRHPVSVSYDAYRGAYGAAYKEDGAAPVIDIRHFFMRKKDSDFISLPYPDEIPEIDEQGNVIIDEKGQPKNIPINKRFGFLRTSFNGRPVYDRNTGALDDDDKILHAAIFNIWEKSHDEQGREIPMEDREPKPIVYYTNVVHPENLIKVSQQVARQWNHAFKSAVFHAQPRRYRSIDDVKDMWILKRNSCHVANVRHWLTKLRSDLKDVVETSARISLSDVENALLDSSSHKLDYSSAYLREIKAKRALEQICSALEFHTEQSSSPFIYERAGDLRFNLVNLEVENNTTGWSGFGPMFSDPLTGETLSATANINLKYIDLRAQQLAKQMSLLKEKLPGLKAVFGDGTSANLAKTPSTEAITATRERVNNFHDAVVRKQDMPATGMKREEIQAIKFAENALLKSTNASIHDIKKSQKSLIEKNAIMDPVRFVDDIARGIAIRYVNLSEHERFMKIREKIFEAVLLHEIGHNVGLRHNMAAAADALNYGPSFWEIEHLPKNIAEAKSLVTDGKLIKQLRECEVEDNLMLHNFNGLTDNLTTQECLQQKNGMYASVMDYHASSLAGVKGLGLYDYAAIKWAYGQVVEVIPKENLLIDANTTTVAKWLRLNDYHAIGKQLFKNAAAINERQHVRYSWNNNGNVKPFPNNAVPYLYCDDPSGFVGPRCLAYDFGPDMQTSAAWLKKRYQEQYLLMQFAKDEAWDAELAPTYPRMDIDILQRFTHILQWYYRNQKDDPDFRGSYAELDYLKAIAMGMNHFAHVIGSPEPGAHISAPIWTLEDQKSLPVGINRLGATNIMVPFNSLLDCDARSITTLNAQGKVNGRFGFHYVDIPLGMGRPLFSRMSGDAENKFMLYHGTSLVKKYALHLLVAPRMASRSSSTVENNDILSMTWYRMFPEAVSKLFAAVVDKRYERLGPLVDDDGKVRPRDVIDEEKFTVIDHVTGSNVMPAIDDSIAIFAAANVMAYLPETINQENNLLASLKISCSGCSDDIEYQDVTETDGVIRYHHLFGEEYKAPSFNHMPSIGATLLREANRQKERLLRLNECIENDDVRNNDPFCFCVKTKDRKAFDSWVCCDEQNADCSEPKLEPVMEGVCTFDELLRRKEQSTDQLNAMVGYIDHLRRLFKEFSL